MGAGNACVFGKLDSLVYIDYDNFRSDEEYELRDWDQERIDWEDSLDCFIETFLERFKSFDYVENEWLSDQEKILMENELYYVVAQDNNWSAAIKLIAKEEDYYEEGQKKNFQLKHFNSYVNGLRECWFEQFNTIGIYGGAYTSGKITKEEHYSEKIGA